MKKTLLTLALCAASLMGTAFAEGLKVEHDKEGTIYVTGSGSYSELLQGLTALGEEYYPGEYNYIRCGITSEHEEVGFSLTFDSSLEEKDKVTPKVGMIEYVKATFTFNELMTLLPQYEDYGDEWKYIGPSMHTGMFDFINPQPGTLNVAVSEDAIKSWLNKEEDLSNRVSYPLLYDVAEIGTSTPEDVLELTLFNAQGEVKNFEFDGHSYENVGIVLDVGTLKANQIALLYEHGAGSGEWGGGALSLVVLGDKYIQVPEPATGTLSLLALAGLAARRRRK